MENILTIENISKYYGNKSNLTKAISNISMNVDKGEFIAIMGASGSGKTTLLNVISTIDKVTSGHIYIEGQDITKLKGNDLNRFRREELGFIFQDFNLLDTLTAYENIALALQIQNFKAKAIEQQIKVVARKLDIEDILNKYRYEIKLNKTGLYNFVTGGNKELAGEGFNYKLKTPEDLFAYEVILNGIRTKIAIDECYNKFMAANYDIFDYGNYEEKRKMFNHDEEKIINNFPSFQDHQSGEIIYIPYLEPFINRYYANDYQLVTLKQHQVYLNSYAKTIDKVIELYGIQPYNSQFSSLQLVGQDDESYYFYHDDFKTVYQFNGQNYRIANEINLIDRYTKEYPNLNLIKEAMVKLANSQDDEEILEFLYENKFVGDKTYKKLIKKLKKVSK